MFKIDPELPYANLGISDDGPYNHGNQPTEAVPFVQRFLRKEIYGLEELCGTPISDLSPSAICMAIGNDATMMAVARHVKPLRDAAETILGIPEKPTKIADPGNNGEQYSRFMFDLFCRLESDFSVTGVWPKEAAQGFASIGRSLDVLFRAKADLGMQPSIAQQWESARLPLYVIHEDARRMNNAANMLCGPIR